VRDKPTQLSVRRTKAQYTARDQGAAVELCYPYHPLHGRTGLVLRKEHSHGECHLRVVFEGGEERLIPQWMFVPQAFKAAPVDLPLINLDAVRHVLRIVLSSGLRLSERGQKGGFDEPIASISTTSSTEAVSSRQGSKGSSRPLDRVVDGHAHDECREAAKSGGDR